MTPRISRRYVDTSLGQAHLRETSAVAGTPTLWCLHATAYSGRTFEPIISTLAGRRQVVAPDTPGYGASDGPANIWPLEPYASSMAEIIEAAGSGPVDLFGYHTGAFVATELAAQRPDLVRRLVLVGVPYFEQPERDDKLALLGKPMVLGETLEQFEERWSFFVSRRTPGVSLEQGFANFVDELRAYPFGYWAHDAAFRYAAESRLSLVEQPTLVLNPDNHLADASRAAAAMMPNARVVELPHLGNAVLDLAGPELALLIDGFLAED